MDRTPKEIIEVCEPLIQEATDALRRYHEAQKAGAPPGEVERLSLIAESAYQAASNYQLHTLGHQPLIRH